MRLSVLVLALCASSTVALGQPDGGTINWHKTFIGVPLTHSANTAPVFHRVGHSKTQTRSVILTVTESSVLAALDPMDGSLVWRHVYGPDDPVLLFRRKKNVVASLSGPGGANFRAFDALTGHLLLERRLHALDDRNTPTSESSVASIAFVRGSSDFLVLINGNEVSRLDGAMGEIKWTWKSEDQGSLVIYDKLVSTNSEVYVIGVAKSFASYTLHVTSLSMDGALLNSVAVASSISNYPSDFLALHAVSRGLIAWLEQGVIKTFSLSPQLNAKVAVIKDATYIKMIDAGLTDRGIFLGFKSDGSSQALKLDGSSPSGLTGFWEFEGSASSPHTSDSIYSGGYDKEGRIYIARVYWSHILNAASAQIFAPHLADGKGLVHGYTFPFDTVKHGIISHVAVDAANPSGWTVITRYALTTTTGSVQLWQQSDLQWTREESLASISAAQLIELPEKKAARLVLRGVSFFNRLTRQIKDAQHFPTYLWNFMNRFATGSYASAISVDIADPFSRDPFGFRQIIVAATDYGKAFGIDSSNGNILWSRTLNLGRAVEGRIVPLKIFVTRAVGNLDASGNGEQISPQVVIVTERRFESEIGTVLFHVDALTGEDSRRVSPSNQLLQGVEPVNGRVVQTFFQDENKFVVLLDESLRAHVYPETSDIWASFARTAPSLHFFLRTTTEGKDHLTGHQFAENLDSSNLFVAYPTWSLSFPPYEKIQEVVPPASPRGPVASIGRVLGNRSTLYKYLNPHLFIVLTASSGGRWCGIYLVDAVKGSIVYRVIVPSTSSGVCDVKATLTENWLVYHYYDPIVGEATASKGYRIVTVELYEGNVDEETRSSDMTSFSSGKLTVNVLEQSYVTLFATTAMSPTTTKFGVTYKDIIVATRGHKIYSVPRRLLDPRRPDRKLTAEEHEEFLIPYEPIIHEDSQRVLSHMYQVANIRRILTAPALLESTSLVFAYGLDLFFTRVAPSNTFDVLKADFNKAQLVLTVSGLAIAIMITKPMVNRKRLREQWYQ